MTDNLTKEQLDRLLLSGALGQGNYDTLSQRIGQQRPAPIKQPAPIQQSTTYVEPEFISSPNPIATPLPQQGPANLPGPLQSDSRPLQGPENLPEQPQSDPVPDTPIKQNTPSIQKEDPLAAYNKSIGDQKQSIKDQTNIQSIESMKIQEERDVLAEKQKADIEAREAQRKANIQEAKDEQALVDKKVSEYSKEKYEGYWEKRSTGEMIMAGLAIAFGALGQAYGGGPNIAVNLINRAMDDDFKVYQANSEKKLKAIGQMRISATKKMDLARQEIADLHARQMAGYDVTKFKIETMAKKANSDISKEKGNELIGQLSQKQAEFKLNYDESMAAHQAKREAAEAKANEKDKKKPMGGEVMKRYDNINGTLEALDGMQDAINKSGGSPEMRAPFVPDDRYEMFRRMAIESYGRMQSGGQMGEEEVANFKSMLPTRSDTKEIVKEKMKIVRKMMMDRKKAIDDVYMTGSDRNIKEAIAWARANPNDPRLAAVLKKVGVQ